MWVLFFQSLEQLVHPTNAALMFGGVLLGLVFGSLPGLSTTMAVALMLPLTFVFTPTIGISMLVAIYVGGISGSCVSAILLRIPGTAASIATTFDGFPLAQQGQPIRALGTAMLASFFGGIIGLGILITSAPLVAGLAIRFGPFEYAALAFTALTLVGTLSSGSILKGLVAACFGLTLSLIGIAPIDAHARYTFGIQSMIGGLAVVPFLIGLYAVPQLILQVGQRDRPEVNLDLAVRGFGVSLSDIRRNIINIIRSALIGMGIGSLPGIGSAAANLVAYGVAKQASKTPEKFGTGTTEGIWAPETANNASVAGALLPLITLGIPGGGVTAVLLGGFTIHNIQPGPLLYSTNPSAIASIYAAFLFAAVLVLLTQLFTIRIFPRVLKTPRQFLIPAIFMITVTGVYISDYRVFDIFVMFGIGCIGFAFERYRFPLAPVVLGFVIGPILEINLRRSLMLSQGDWAPFVTNPISATFLVLAMVAILFGALRNYRRA
ncbi:Tat pathway signal protein [Brucellaceae bacterium VT-16-1752]|nr:Tat pathway signal protein [Brucellaceae bacterium VT-16-1752]